MKNYWVAVIAAAMLSAASQAQETTQGQETAPSTVTTAVAENTPAPETLLKGTGIVAELSDSLKANKLKPGDKIKGEVTQDVLIHGKTVIPAGSKLVGHVTEAKKRSEGDTESRLAFVFEKVRMKGHKELAFKAVLQALAPPAPRESLVDKPDMMLPPSMMLSGPNNQGTGAQPVGGRSSSASRSSGGSNTSNASASTAPVSANVTATTAPQQMASNASPSMMGNKPLGNGSRGIFGLPGLALRSGTVATVIVSKTREVKLEYGTQMILLITESVQ